MTCALVHIAFYQFVAIDDPAHLAAQLRVATRHVLGSILVAKEGINGVLCASQAALEEVVHWLGQDPRLAGMAFKRSACSTVPFARMKVHVRSEIVAAGLPLHSHYAPTGGQLLSPQNWRSLMAQSDVVLLDNRNSFEYRLGHFKSAVDPGVSSLRDFPRYVASHAARWREENKRVAMYCTGGIRCEKISGWMAHDLGLDVVQLEGGVLNYFQSMADALQDWQGECFVFDNRIALNTRLEETATTAQDVYGDAPGNAWRLERASRLDSLAGHGGGDVGTGQLG
jgi:UPF0176 protein